MDQVDMEVLWVVVAADPWEVTEDLRVDMEDLWVDPEDLWAEDPRCLPEDPTDLADTDVAAAACPAA